MKSNSLKIAQSDPKSTQSWLKPLCLGAAMIALIAGTGCATTALLEDMSSKPYMVTTKQTLLEDELVAFGRPVQALPNMPSNSVVIIGEKNSFVLTQGGTKMVSLLTNLSAKNIQVDNDMTFYSPKNDGYFEGKMDLSYAKLKDEFKRSDYQFFLQNGGKECTTRSDTRINAQRFCFSVPIQGAVYPQVNNFEMVRSQYKALSKPYAMSIYTKTQSQSHNGGAQSVGKLVLLPFALAFDVVTFPILLLSIVD